MNAPSRITLRRTLRLAALLVAALPLLGCGNKGPLVLAPSPIGGPPPPADPVMPAESATVAPPSASTIAPPQDATETPATETPAIETPAIETPATDGTSGNPR